MTSRKRTIVGAGVAAVVAVLGSAAGASAQAPSGDAGLTLPPGYVDSVNHALAQKDDYWGEQLMAKPDGPTLQDVRDRLVPVNVAGTYLTDSGWYYLPFTMPRPDPQHWAAQRDFALHVADGSQLLSEDAQDAGTARHSFDTCDEASECVTFYVGPDGDEVFGSAHARMSAPRLDQGYQPVLENGYTDAAGVRWRRESFAARPAADGPVVSFLHFSSDDPGASLRVRVDVPGSSGLTLDGQRLMDGDKTVLTFTGHGDWSGPYLTLRPDRHGRRGELYLSVPTTPTTASTGGLDRGAYAGQKVTVERYWNRVLRQGTGVDLPDRYAEDAYRNVLLQNLVLGLRLSVGNAYEGPKTPSFAYIPEASASLAVLGEFGYESDYGGNLQELLPRGQGASYFPNWEKGFKLEDAARYYQLSGDGDFLKRNLATFEGYLDDLHAQRAADPNGLPRKERTASDIGQPIYGFHDLTVIWRGLRDMGVALRMAGEGDAAQRFTDEAAGLHEAIARAVTASERRLPDGSLYVPLSLLDPTADAPYDFITATRSGSYWNLLAPYAYATGFFAPHTGQADASLDYLDHHGSMLLGLPRFNYTGTAIGDCKTGYPAGIEGYKTPGLDAQYGYSLVDFLADNDQWDRIPLAVYGKLGADMTPYTFVNGEGTTIGACPQLGEYYRTTWNPPLGSSNATFLESLRLSLVDEKLDANGVPSVLEVAPATARSWLRSGEHVGARELPTMFGRVSYEIRSHLDQGFVTARVDPPAAGDARARPQDVVLHLRTPSNATIRKVLVDGHDRTASVSGNAIHLGAITRRVHVIAYYDQARHDG